MHRYTLKQIAEILDIPDCSAEVAINQVSTDTRNIQDGDLFIALSGENFNGHDFVNQAAQKGAVAAIVSQNVTTKLPTLRVDDTIIALGQLAKYHRQQYDIPVIGITGSCGKTTAKAMLAHILSLVGPTLASPASYNNHIGVPLTLLQLNAQHQFAVIEMGANHANEIAYVTALAQPTIAALLNAGPVHLEGFGDVDGVARAKSEIFQGLPENGTAIINKDDQYADYWQQLVQKYKIITFGQDQQANVRASNVQQNAQGLVTFDCHFYGERLPIQLNLLGKHNVYNAVAAAACALALDIAPTKIQQGLQTFNPVGKRLNIKNGIHGTLLIDDSYNANPKSVKAALDVLTQFPRKKIFVLGDMGELGEEAIALHQEIGHYAKLLGIERFYAYGTLSQHAANAYGDSAQSFMDKKALNTALIKELGPDVVIMAKGSKTQKMWEVITALQIDEDIEQ